MISSEAILSMASKSRSFFITEIISSRLRLNACLTSSPTSFPFLDDIDDRFPLAKEALKHGNVFLHMDEVTSTAIRRTR